MEVLIVVLMEDLTMKDNFSRVLLMHTVFFTPYIDDHYYLIGPLVLLYVDVFWGRGNVGGMVDIRRVYYVGGYVFQIGICYFWLESSSKVLS